jgi:hypothetical protein
VRICSLARSFVIIRLVGESAQERINTLQK